MRARIDGPTLVGSIFVLVAATLAATEPSKPSKPSEPSEYSALNGERTYKTYCAGCHGVGGTGDGYIAETLRKRPTDLTGLSEANDGAFPEARVQAVIDGQAEVRSHGQREMPVWGDVFLWPDGDTPERREVVKRKLGELISYLKSIQRPSEAKD